MYNSKLTQLLFLFLFIGFGCKSVKQTNDSNQKLEKALLWEISGNGLQTPSYVYGTIHLIPAEHYFLPEGTMTAIDQSKKMIFEIDMASMNDMGQMMKIMPKLMMKNGTKLKDLVSNDDYEKIGAKFKDMGLPMFFLESIKPFFLSAFLSVDMKSFKEEGGFGKGMKSYEMEFNTLAKTKNMETGGVETLDDQINMVDSIPYNLQAEMLVSQLESGESSSLDKLAQIYKTQDIVGMQNLMNEKDENGKLENEIMKDYEHVLLDDRNKRWIPKMSEEMKKQTTFFAFGAAHLAGKNGVLPLLQAAGYKIKPLSNKK